MHQSLVDDLARWQNCWRDDVIFEVIKEDRDDIEDLRAGVAALRDPADPVLDWSEVRDARLGVDEPDAV